MVTPGRRLRRRRRLLAAFPHLTPPARTATLPSRSKERKELDRARKARKHKNFNLIQEVVALWEEARRQDITPEKRSKLVSAIMGKIQGRVAELAGSHSASRVIQTCTKHGTPAGAPGGGGGLWRGCAGQHARWKAAALLGAGPSAATLLRRPPTGV